MYLNIAALSLCQAILMISISTVISTSVLVSTQMSINSIWVTLPLTIQYLTTMLVMIPVSKCMQYFGRRAIFISGALIGALGMAFAAMGIYIGNFIIFSAAGIFLGIYNAIGQYYRFAAVEVSDKDKKNHAISLTLMGGVLAAFFGPEIAKYTHNILTPEFTASFISLCAVLLFSVIAVSTVTFPDTKQQQNSSPMIPVRPLFHRHTFILAVCSSALGYSTMNLLMISSPLSMHNSNMTFSEITFAIQWHFVAMFAPSFFTGDLIRKFGVQSIIVFGAILEIAAATINLMGDTQNNFIIGLLLLGVGWNFMFIGGTSLLSDAYMLHEKHRAQGINDLIVFTMVTLSSLVSGVLMHVLGWNAVNYLSIIPPIIVIVLVMSIMKESRYR